MLEGHPLRHTVEQVANGEIQPEPRTFVAQLMREGGVTKRFIAKALGVQPGQVHGKAAGMKERELRKFCNLVLEAK